MMDESRVLIVQQYVGGLSLAYQFQLEGMGKPDKFKVNTPGFTPVKYTIQEMREKMCKVAKKLLKRSKRKQKQKDVVSQVVSEENDKVKGQGGSTSSFLANIAHVIFRPFGWTKPKEIQPTPVEDPDVNPETLNLITIKLFDENKIQIEDYDLETKDAFQDGRSISIQISNEIYIYDVYTNLPSVRILELPKHISSEYLLYPRIETDFCDPADCQFDWFRIKTRPTKQSKLNIQCGRIYSGNIEIELGASTVNSLEDNSKAASGNDESLSSDFIELTISDVVSEDAKEVTGRNNGQQSKDASPCDKASSGVVTNKSKSKSNPTWEWLYRGNEYTSSAEDVNCYIGVVCTPRFGDRIGCPMVTETKNMISRRPINMPYEKRHQETKLAANEMNGFRMVSYNILSEIYSDTCECRDVRYNYCPAYALTYDHRKQLIIDELLGYKADVICLQEVDRKAFDNHLLPVFSRRGYEGRMATKYVNVSQGVATFYDSGKFELIHNENINTAKALKASPIHEQLLSKLGENDTFNRKIEYYAAVLNITILQHKSTGKQLLIANTHLKSGREFCHVRIVQTLVAVQHVCEMSTNYPGVTIVFAGDFNSVPYSGVVDLFLKGKVKENHVDWFVGGRHDFISGMNFEIPAGPTFESAYKDVPFTNYTSGFIGVLDHIFFDANLLRCVKTVPMPSRDEIVELIALPNQKCPSDHLALVCDLEWKEQSVAP